MFNVKQFLTYFLQGLKTEYILGVCHRESIEWFIEDQAFLWSYDLDSPPSPPLPTSPVSKVSLFLDLPVRSRVGGMGAKSYDREKAWSSTNHSILSGVCIRLSTVHWVPYIFVITRAVMRLYMCWREERGVRATKQSQIPRGERGARAKNGSD